MEEAITAILKADAALTLLIGDRVHWGRAPQGAARPYVILQVISALVDKSMEGRNGLEQARLQLDSYSETALEAKTISNAAVRALEMARGLKGLSMLHSVSVDSRRDFQPDGGDALRPLYRRQTDLMIWHTTNS